MTVRTAVEAYETLQGIPPKHLNRALTTQVVEAAQALEPIAMEHAEKMSSHRDRIVGDEEELSDEGREELREIASELGEEPVDVDLPTIDPYQAPSVAITREFLSVEALRPLFPERT